MWKTITAGLDRRGLSPFPPTKERIKALGAALKAGSYTSARQYLYHYRSRCAQESYPFPAPLNKLMSDFVRSCERGMGAPVKASALPLLRLHELDLTADAPWAPGGPVGPACAMVAGAWFLTREIELSTSRAALVSLEKDSEGHPVVKWFLPASKTDQEARGTSRAHGCACGNGPLVSCPFHAVELQLRRLRRLFPDRWVGGLPAEDLPLFPDAAGLVVTKEARRRRSWKQPVGCRCRWPRRTALNASAGTPLGLLVPRVSRALASILGPSSSLAGGVPPRSWATSGRHPWRLRADGPCGRQRRGRWEMSSRTRRSCRLP